jgi:RNA polymerase sigma-70 factor, ECF subfamily
MAIDVHEVQPSATVDIERDRGLVLRHQRGDSGAFDELYRRYHHRLVTYCMRRVGDRDTAEELAQEAFVKALRAMPSFDGERRFYPWMTVIAHRLCIDHHRHNARVEPTAEVDTGSVEPDHEELFASVDRDHLADALTRLAPRHRHILELREQRGLSYQEIARQLDVPVTTVEALLHRARKALRREFLSLSGARSGRFAALVGGGLLARVKSWGPAAGTAAAGTVAAAVLTGPLSIGGGFPELPLPDPAPVEIRVEVQAEPISFAPVSVPVAAAAPAPAPEVPTAPASTSEAAPAPAPVAAAGPAAVYTGPEATAWAESQNDQQPVQAGIPDVVDVGLDPVQLLSDALDPGGAP